jgi:hypothetical protein
MWVQRPRTLDAKALIASLAILASLCAYRFYNYWTTGFYVSDEFGYYYDAVHGAIYSDRWFFGWVNIILFKALGITGADAFSFLLPFYLFFWTAITLIVFYKFLKLIGFDEVVTALSLMSSFVLIAFILLSLGFLTEPVGLCMAMLGIYFLARYMKSETARGNVALPLLSACFFGFAAGTREPYNAFLIGGVLIVVMLAFGKRKAVLRDGRLPPTALLAASVLAFVLPSLFFLFIPTHAYAEQVAPISSQLVQSISHPLTSTGLASVPFYRQFIVTNAFLIFFGGVILGWGPICFAIALAGLLVLLRRSFWRKDATARFILLTSVIALGSYFIVSFINAPDPYYFSFQNYSTVIRFSDTALPAYFMAAPFFLLTISKNRRRMAALGAVFVAFLLIAVPVYQVYAASNFNYTTQNPFQLGYRTDAALLRNYFAANDSDQAVDLVGVPYGWSFTPGVQDLHSVQAYASSSNPLFPELTLSNFTSMRWPVFYLYVNAPASAFPPETRFLVQFFNSTAGPHASAAAPFTILGTQPVLRASDFTLYEVHLAWS